MGITGEGELALPDYDIDYIGGYNNVVTIQLARTIDARTVDIVFSRAVNRSDAETPANYTVSPSLTITRATKVTDNKYRLKTSQQVAGQLYTITISNIRGI